MIDTVKYGALRTHTHAPPHPGPGWAAVGSTDVSTDLSPERATLAEHRDYKQISANLQIYRPARGLRLGSRAFLLAQGSDVLVEP